MTRRVRQEVREAYNRRCGYCGIHEDELGSELTIDHYQPRVHAGSDDSKNLVYCCHACNSLKATYWSEATEKQILHPRTDDLLTHLRRGEDGRLIALTSRGQIHIDRLGLNRPALVARRIRELTLAKQLAERAKLIQRVADLEGELNDLEERLSELQG